MPTRHPRHRSLLLPRKDDGLSLAEMVVAIAVVMVVLISSGAAFIRMGEAQRSAEAADRGTQMIQDKLETIRKLPYDQVGCYQNDVPCPVKVPTTSPQNVTMGEFVVRFTKDRPPVSEGVASAPVPSEDVVIGDPVSGNKYAVKTVVTWADLTDTGRTGASTLAALAPYAAKRVTVTASWKLGATTRSVTRQWLRSPSTSELLPPAAGTGSGSGCVEPWPVCTIGITDGQVLTAYPELKLSRPVQFTVQMWQPGTSVTVHVGAINQGLTTADGGRTFTRVLPIGTSTGVKPGLNKVNLDVITDTVTKTVTKDVNWRLPIPVDYQMQNLRSVADSSRTTSNPAWAAGPESARPWFCVKNDGTDTLLTYTAVIFDEVNVDDMDAYTKPNIYATGLAPANPNLSAVITGHPSGYISGYNPITGYVGLNGQLPGYLNTVRWTYGFQPGVTVFSGDSSSVTVSGVRPGDGAAANATLTMPVYRVPGVGNCADAPAFHTIPATPSTPSVMDIGNGNISVDWGDVTGATGYKVYRKIGVGGIYGPPVDTATSSYTDIGSFEGGLNYYYYVTAWNNASTSSASPANYVTFSYPSVILGDKPVAYYRLGEPATSPLHKPSVLAANPAGYWPLDDSAGTSAANKVAGGSPGLATAVTFGQAGPNSPANAASFNGASSFISVPNTTALNTPNAITVEAWVKPISTTGQYRMIATKSPIANGATQNTFELRLDTTGRLEFLQANDTALSYTARSSNPVTGNTWHHVAATKSGTTVTLYVDGVPVQLDFLYAPWPAGTWVNGAPMLIGKRADGLNFNGNISDVALYPFALTPALINDHYRGVPTADDSALAHTYPGEYTGGPALGVSGNPLFYPVDTAMTLNGSGSQYVTLPAGISTKMGNKTAVSAEGWVNLTALPSPGTGTCTGLFACRAIISKQYPNDGDIVTSLHFNPTGRAVFGIFSGGTWHEVTDPTVVTLNTWMYYAGVLDNGTMRLYRNGQQVATFAWAGQTPAGGTGLWYIGKRWDLNQSPSGKIDEVALYDTALSPARVLAHYNSGS